MDDALVDLLTRLVRFHDEFGAEKFDVAIRRCRLVIAEVALHEAESMVREAPQGRAGNILPFPRDRAGRPSEPPDWLA